MMSKTPFPFAAQDISALARSLSRELDGCAARPTHVQMLNMLARAAGYRNFQHFRAQRMAQLRLDAPADAGPPVDHRQVERVAGHFDSSGVMIRWPSRTNHQALCLWVLWSRLPAGEVMTETQINERLRASHAFGDPAILRRSMFGDRLVTRTRDCREYRRIERIPPPEAIALIRHLGRRGTSPIRA
jgi:hypothetical protein